MRACFRGAARYLQEFQNYENGFTAPKCLCFSDMSHLYADGLDMIHDNRFDI